MRNLPPVLAVARWTQLAPFLLPLAMLASGAAACSQEPVKVQNTATSDYGRDQLNRAVAEFVAQGRSPAAYAAFAKRVHELQPTMDKSVAEEAELKLTVLALAPIQSMKELPVAAQAKALATTVWPTAFAPPLRATTQLRNVALDEVKAEVAPLDGESPEVYLQRLCGDALNKVCRDSVPEHQPAILAAYAVNRFSERARSAVADCLSCSTDPSWRAAARGWEELESANNTWLKDVERRGSPSNWPVAGPAAEAYVDLPALELSTLGELMIAEQPIIPSMRDKALRVLVENGKAQGKQLALHVRADVSLARLRELVAELQRAGASTVALVTREPRYPWERRLYRVAIGRGRRVQASANDTLQVLLRQIDPIGPGLTRID